MKKLGFGIGLIALMAGCGDEDEPAGDSASAFEELVQGLGGAERLDALTGLRIAGEGSRSIPHEGVRPEDEPILANTFERTVSLDLEEELLRVDTTRQIEFLFPGMQMYSDIVRGNLGASTQPFFGTPLGALGSDKVASIRRQEMLLTPHYLLRELDGASVATEADVELDGVPHHQLVASGGPAPLRLFVDHETGMLTKLQTMEHDFYRRDVMLEIEYRDWQPTSSGLSFPRELRVVRDGLTLFTQEVTEVEENPSFEASTFDFPEDVTPTFDEELYERGELSHQWYYLLDSLGLPFTGVDVAVTPVEVAPSVVQLQGGSHHSFVVEQADGIVLVDAPLYEDRGRALFEYIDGQFAGKPITHVVASHFHEDHVAGIREVLGATEATLVVHASSEAFWREVLAAPSRLRPDALEDSPREVTLLTVPEDGEITLADATRPVNLYHLATEHAADMLLTHETSSNSVFVVDIYSPGNDGQLGAADLNAALTQYSVPTDDLRIVGGHGNVVHDYAALQAALQ